MSKKGKKSSFQREHETYCRAAKFVNESRKNRTQLYREFLRVPYGLAVKKS